jgi:hypothetical protein
MANMDSNDLNGQRLQAPGDATVWIVDQGKARPITGAAFGALFRAGQWLPSPGIATPKGPLLGDGSKLIRSADGPDRATVFLLDVVGDGQITKRPITAAGVPVYGFNLAVVEAVPQSYLDSLSNGPLIDAVGNDRASGMRLQIPGEPTVYILDQRSARPVTASAYQVFSPRLVMISPGLAVPPGPLLGDGSKLIRSADGPDRATVFLLDVVGDGQITKRPITAAGVPVYGFNLAVVEAVPQSYLDTVSNGPLIDNTRPLTVIRQNTLSLLNATVLSGIGKQAALDGLAVAKEEAINLGDSQTVEDAQAAIDDINRGEDPDTVYKNFNKDDPEPHDDDDDDDDDDTN